MVDETVPPAAGTLAERLERILMGRSPWKWATSVMLSAGTMKRLRDGALPDIGLLVPAARTENLSLTWLAIGQGPPFVVVLPVTEADAADRVWGYLERESDAKVLLVFCEVGYTVVLHAPSTAATARGAPYDYLDVEVIGGRPWGADLIHAINARVPDGHLQALRVDAPTWRRLAGGELGTWELFGSEQAPGLTSDAEMVRTRRDQVSAFCLPDEPASIAHVADAAVMDYLASRDREILALFRPLSNDDQLAAMRMLQGLHGPT